MNISSASLGQIVVAEFLGNGGYDHYLRRTRKVHVQGIAERTGSLALKSNGQHLLVDCVTSLGVLAALVVTKMTGWKQADPVFAILLALWMAYGSWRLSHQAFHQLIDRRLEQDEIAAIHDLVYRHDGVLDYHRLRTRLSGNTRYVDMQQVCPISMLANNFCRIVGAKVCCPIDVDL